MARYNTRYRKTRIKYSPAVSKARYIHQLHLLAASRVASVVSTGSDIAKMAHALLETKLIRWRIVESHFLIVYFRGVKDEERIYGSNEKIVCRYIIRSIAHTKFSTDVRIFIVQL